MAIGPSCAAKTEAALTERLFRIRQVSKSGSSKQATSPARLILQVLDLRDVDLAPGGSSGRNWRRRRRRTALGMFDDRVDQVRVDLQHELTQDAVVDLTLAVERGDGRGRAAKINQPIRALALPVDRIRQ